MTDTTDIKALSEHNQHIVAHLTRSNPRRPLSSAEVLTLESAKLVVAALSVRDGIPDADYSEYWFEHEGKLLFDGALFNSRVAIFIDSQLEAERQRADDDILASFDELAAIVGFSAELCEQTGDSPMDCARELRQRADEAHKYGSERDAENESLMLTVGRLRTELAALKGDQVPVAYTDKLSLETLQSNGMACMWKQGQGAEWREQIELFTAPQKPVVPVGFLFVVKATGAVIYSIADAAIEGAQLIGQIYGDAAIEAAGGSVKDGE